jgi:hypothetical protein
MNEVEKRSILAMRLGAKNIPIQPVHPVPPGMRFAHAVAAEPFGSPIDFDVRAFPQAWESFATDK